MRPSFAASAFAFVLLFAAPAGAACPQLFSGGAAPRQVHVAYAAHAQNICYEAFAVWVSGETRTPLWSAEHLTANSVAAAHTLPRRDSFHAERNLPAQDRAELADYAHSGYDRGHMAPSGDMPSPSAQQQSFSLANIVPQDPALNRGLWEELEVATRDLAETDGDVYVVTGPIFAQATETLRGRVLVPTAVFKAIYDTRRNIAAAYIASNTHSASLQLVSITALRERVGFDVFPAASEAVKARAIDLLGISRNNRRQVADAGVNARVEDEASALVGAAQRTLRVNR